MLRTLKDELETKLRTLSHDAVPTDPGADEQAVDEDGEGAGLSEASIKDTSPPPEPMFVYEASDEVVVSSPVDIVVHSPEDDGTNWWLAF